MLCRRRPFWLLWLWLLDVVVVRDGKGRCGLLGLVPDEDDGEKACGVLLVLVTVPVGDVVWTTTVVVVEDGAMMMIMCQRLYAKKLCKY